MTTNETPAALDQFTDWNTEQFERFFMLASGWDVRAAKVLLSDAPRKTHGFDPSGLRNLVPPRDKFGIGVGIDWEIVDSGAVDLDVPVILAQLETSKLPIDGWHRIAKALEEGVDELPCVVLTRSETLSVELQA